ncbi:MAG: hypothetical protein AB7E47_13045 [Desulfovibrionaceae bacterium]
MTQPPNHTHRLLRRVARYVRASPLPHATAAVAMVLAGVVGWCGVADGDGGTPGWLLVAHALGWLGLAGFALADGYSRWREFVRLRVLFRRHGFRPRIVHPVTRSRCQRDAAVAAADEAGCGDAVRRHFHALGYRAHHLFPDRIMANPLLFFHPRFVMAAYLPKRRPECSGRARKRGVISV